VTIDSVDLLRKCGIQVTAQRLAVMRTVSSLPHVSAEKVTEVVELNLGTISRQAVYDALTVLVENGLVRRIQPVGSAALYEDRVSDNHHHLICRICSHVTDVDCVVGTAPCLEASEDLGYEIDEAEIAFWGRCSQCKKDGRVATRLDPRSDRRHLTNRVRSLKG